MAFSLFWIKCRKVKWNEGFKIKNRTYIVKYDSNIKLSVEFEDYQPFDKLNTLENCFIE